MCVCDNVCVWQCVVMLGWSSVDMCADVNVHGCAACNIFMRYSFFLLTMCKHEEYLLMLYIYFTQLAHAMVHQCDQYHEYHHHHMP